MFKYLFKKSRITDHLIQSLGAELQHVDFVERLILENYVKNYFVNRVSALKFW